MRKDYTAGVLSELRHFYYSEVWQPIEERVSSGSSPDRHYVWGIRYHDDLALRDRSLNGTLDETLYALHDANRSVTSIANSAGVIQERVAYTPYGRMLVLSGSFNPLSSSTKAWNVGYASYFFEGASQLLCIRYRYYSPALGTWMSRDPLQDAPSSNLYEYVNSAPLGHVDPFGLEGEAADQNKEAVQAGYSMGCGVLAHGIISEQVRIQNQAKFDSLFLDRAVSTIAREVGNCKSKSLLRPDILMVKLTPDTAKAKECCRKSSGPLYEIKPDSAFGRTAGPAKVAAYVALLAPCDVTAIPGHADAGTTGGFPYNPGFAIPKCGILGWVSRGGGMIYYTWYSFDDVKERVRQQKHEEDWWVGHAGDSLDVGLEGTRQGAIYTAIGAGTLATGGLALEAAAAIGTVGAGVEAASLAGAAASSTAASTYVAPVLAAGVAGVAVNVGQ